APNSNASPLCFSTESQLDLCPNLRAMARASVRPAAGVGRAGFRVQHSFLMFVFQHSFLMFVSFRKGTAHVTLLSPDPRAQATLASWRWPVRRSNRRLARPCGRPFQKLESASHSSISVGGAARTLREKHH